MQKNKLTFFIHPPTNFKNEQLRGWPIEDKDEIARVSIEDENYSYSISIDGAGMPFLNVWSKNEIGELNKEVIRNPILIPCEETDEF